MDLRVLAAVFLTLFAVAIGMSQGDVSLDDVSDIASGLQTSGDLSTILQQAGKRTANTTITGELTAPDTAELEIRSRSRLELGVGPANTIHVGESTLSTAENTSLVADGFRGTVHIAPDNMTVTGSVSSIATPQFDFSYGSPKSFTVTSPVPKASIHYLETQDFKFVNATGAVTASGTRIEVEQERAWFRGFTGNLSVDGITYTLEGRIRSAVLGDATVG
ncbi:MAG: hypothetical protein SVW02_04315 [Candidatus Nanohaloarchaea archaeon]|nr:hypothetical protein [Candidatus Nanohaloarchaea archaeon]